MDIKALRQFVIDNPDGVVIRMIDGAEYQVPHRDYVWFTPGAESDARGGRSNTSFYVSVDGVGHLVNALLVREVIPAKPGRGSHPGKGKRRKAG